MTYLLFVLYFAAIFAVFLSISHLIDAVGQYKYNKTLMNVFKNKNTQELFRCMKPYFNDYLNILDRDVSLYAKRIKLYEGKHGSKGSN